MLRNWLKRLRWARSKSMTSGEIDVLKLLLPAEDERSTILLAQAIDPPSVERRLIGKSKFEAAFPYVKGSCKLIDLEVDLKSPAIDLELTPSGRKARFRVEVLRGGFLGPLSGEALDGNAWDYEWEIAADSTMLSRMSNWLPAKLSSNERSAILDKLETWARLRPGELSTYDETVLCVRHGCSAEDLRAMEIREGLTRPQEFAEFLRISDGVGVWMDDWQYILGSRDAYKVSVPGMSSESWLIVDLREDGAIVLDAVENNAIVTRVNSDNSTSSIGSLADYFARVIASTH